MRVAENDHNRMTGPDCAVMCNLINTHVQFNKYTHTHTHTHAQWLPAGNHPPPRRILHKDGMELSHSQSGAPPGTGSIPS